MQPSPCTLNPNPNPCAPQNGILASVEHVASKITLGTAIETPCRKERTWSALYYLDTKSCPQTQHNRLPPNRHWRSTLHRKVSYRSVVYLVTDCRDTWISGMTLTCPSASPEQVVHSSSQKRDTRGKISSQNHDPRPCLQRSQLCCGPLHHCSQDFMLLLDLLAGL
jgi:hypothetical protein